MHVYGESTCGTSVGIYLHVLAPQLVKSLILVSPMHGYEQKNLELYQRVLRELLQNRSTTSGSTNDKLSLERPLHELMHVFQGRHTRSEDRDAWYKRVSDRYGKGHVGLLFHDGVSLSLGPIL